MDIETSRGQVIFNVLILSLFLGVEKKSALH